MGKTIEKIITYLKVQAVQDQGEAVVKTVEDFQKLANTARDETRKLVGSVQVVDDTLDEAKRLLTTAFSKIPCSGIPTCLAIQVSFYS